MYRCTKYSLFCAPIKQVCCAPNPPPLKKVQTCMFPIQSKTKVGGVTHARRHARTHAPDGSQPVDLSGGGPSSQGGVTADITPNYLYNKLNQEGRGEEISVPPFFCFSFFFWGLCPRYSTLEEQSRQKKKIFVCAAGGGEKRKCMFNGILQVALRVEEEASRRELAHGSSLTRSVCIFYGGGGECVKQVCVYI